MLNLEKLKYPIGKFEMPENVSQQELEQWIIQIKSLPERLRKEVQTLKEEQLNTPYRPEGWTVRQVIHHLADSHMNSFIRIKLALTENNPVIKPYYEKRWAELPDSLNFPIASSLAIVEGVHERWGYLLEQLTEEDLKKTFIHPGINKEFTIKESIGTYAWHGNHHLAHITHLKETKNW